MVERYGGLAGGIVPADDGPWVRYSDYMVMEADRDFWKERLQVETRARIEAEALSRTGAVKVRPLEWRGTEGVWAKADALFGATYRINEYSGMAKPFKLETVGFVGPSGHYELIDEAKAAAQADYERRILSALSTEPAAPQEAEAVGSKRVRDAERIVRSFAEDRLKSTTQWALDPRYLITLCDAVRSRPAEQAVTEAMVERLAQHLALDHIAIDDRAEYSWDAANEQWRQSWRRKARAALKAAMEAGR